MKHIALTKSIFSGSFLNSQYRTYLFIFCLGLVCPLGFAPFDMPVLTLLTLSLLYSSIINSTKKQGAILGFVFGIGYFGLGISWIIISIHDYGELNYIVSALVTLVFILYLSIFPALTVYVFKVLEPKRHRVLSILLFSSLWCISEWLRAHVFGGFPWLLMGITQINTPLRFFAPLFGIYGLSFLSLLSSCLLTCIIRTNSRTRYYYLLLFLILFLVPSFGKHVQWTQLKKDPVSIGVIQANLSMRNKWDDTLFWDLLKYYGQAIDKLLGKQLIILPESAIPLPSNYLDDYLIKLHEKALQAQSALMLGILQPTDNRETHYFNSIISLGQAKGTHIKHQLVPFGEYIPAAFEAINRWLKLPEPNILPGKNKQKLIKVMGIPIASLICYEIAYPHLLRAQMPVAQWIVSISDNGWFGHSLASYQQLEMAQMLSLMSGRYQIVVNNDGLSSIINNEGDIVTSLPPFRSGILEGSIFPAEGTTPWILWQDYPVIIFSSIILIIILFLQLRQFLKGYPIAGKSKREYPSASPSLD